MDQIFEKYKNTLTTLFISDEKKYILCDFSSDVDIDNIIIEKKVKYSDIIFDKVSQEDNRITYQFNTTGSVNLSADTNTFEYLIKYLDDVILESNERKEKQNLFNKLNYELIDMFANKTLNELKKINLKIK